MSSVIDLCNMALSRIGNSQRIDSLTERSIQAEQCALFYEPSRDFVLRDFAWGFATSFAKLAQVEANPDPSYAYAYALPIDCLKVHQVVGGAIPAWGYFNEYVDLPRFPATPYRIIGSSSGRLLATHISPATLEYTQAVTNPELFDPIFVSALAWRLAGQIAPAISKDAGVSGNCEAMYQQEIRQAAAAMLNEGQTGFMAESSFITGRY